MRLVRALHYSLAEKSFLRGVKEPLNHEGFVVTVPQHEPCRVPFAMQATQARQEAISRRCVHALLDIETAGNIDGIACEAAAMCSRCAMRFQRRCR
jgi:hypothetical protein